MRTVVDLVKPAAQGRTGRTAVAANVFKTIPVVSQACNCEGKFTAYSGLSLDRDGTDLSESTLGTASKLRVYCNMR